ncbi:hypothetical protein GCM10010430_61910 [Kitasatospora cystarginea]|uniref:TPM domain-containing protein n=1 Tax=Kitasatospora cystarginea TaxID=58350 RepID=A0ABP5RRX4_9ACTN
MLRRPPAARPAARSAALLVGLLGLLLLLIAPSASAAGGIDEAATSLKKSQVYVDPAMTSRFSEDQAAALGKKLRDSGKAVYIAVIPDSAQYPSGTVARDLRDEVGVVGLYGIWRGNEFKAFADKGVASKNTVSNMAGAAVRSHPGDINGALNDFADHAVRQVKGHAPEASSGGISTAAIVIPLALLVLAGGGVFLLFRRAKKRREEKERAELAQLRTVVDEDITAFGEELDRLDFNPGAPDADDAQRADYSHALDAYERAKQTMDAAKRPADVSQVTEALADGRFALATLAARREKRPLPERRSPCFFDPRHGVSVQDVYWAPTGGAPRTVPACAADAARVTSGQEPDIRTVQTEYGQQPYWNAGPAYSPWAGGYYGSGVLPGLLVGTALGSIIAGPDTAWAAGSESYGHGHGGLEAGDDSGANFDPSDFGGFDGGFDGGGDSDFGGF